MKCRIKKVNSDMYFNKHIGLDIIPNHWTFIGESKVFDSIAEARATMKVYKLKNVEVERCK